MSPFEQPAGADRLAVGAVEGGGELGRIGHDADILVAGRVERLADGADAAVHHVGGRDDIGAGLGLHDGGPGDLRHRLVVDDLAVAQDAVMAVAGEGIERHVGDDADIRHRLLDRPRRLVDQVVGGKAVGAGLVAQRHFDVRKGGKGRDAEVGRFLRGFHGLVDAHAVDAGHGIDRLDDAGAGNDEDRPDQVVDRQPVFLHHPARPVGLAVAAHAAMAGDEVNGIGLVGHVVVFRSVRGRGGGLSCGAGKGKWLRCGTFTLRSTSP